MTLSRFDDIYGHTQTKKDLNQIIDYFKNPSVYRDIGARLRRGVLLYGPSGTGKTMIAKALANEAGVRFIYKSAAQFVEMYVGVGPRRIRDLFDLAKTNAPCIVFIDEIDAIGARNVQTDAYGKNNDERNATVNQLLIEMDGFDENDQVVVVAATNREKFLDFALVRSGRFDLKIPVNLPNAAERTGILLLKLAKTKHNITEEQALEFGNNSANLSGADIDAIVNESIYLAKSLGEEEVNFEHLKSGQRKITQGLITVSNQLV